MTRTAVLWVCALALTVGTAVYQRLTGPTHPVSGEQILEGIRVHYTFERSHSVSSDAPVNVLLGGEGVEGVVIWKRYRSTDPWMTATLEREGNMLTALLPAQPAAGKVIYQVRLNSPRDSILVPEEPVIMRFKGDVPLWVLIPHVLFMFASMLLSARTGLEFFRKEPAYRSLTVWTTAVLFVGGLLLGPLVQLYAFDAWWTGWPLGTDLTDNKTAIAFFAWLAALVAVVRSDRPGPWVVAASLIMLAVFLVPHSLWGSELDPSAAHAP